LTPPRRRPRRAAADSGVVLESDPTGGSLAVIVATFPEHERAPAIGTWTAWGTIAGALGPLVAGGILGVASWRWIFVINVPLVLVCLLLIVRAVPSKAPTGAHRKVDVVGALLCVVGLGGSVFALIEQPRLGWSSVAVSGSLIGEEANPRIRVAAIRALLAEPEVARVTYLRLEFVGPRVVSVVGDVDLTGDDTESHVAVRLRALEAKLDASPAVAGTVLSLSAPDEPSLTE
jgi:MFS family permease